MKVAFVSAEAAPWAKTGGLGDVVGALPAALKRVDPQLEVCVFLPLYERVWKALAERGIRPEPTEIECAARLYGQPEFGRVQRYTDDDGVIWAFLEHHGFYHRQGLYGDQNGAYFDSAARFAFLCRGALDCAPKVLGGRPDVFHCHDWHTGPLPMYLKTRYRPAYPGTGSVLTIHNLGYQGVYAKDLLPGIGLPWDLFTPDVAEYYDHVNLLKGGIACADATTTVSPTYAKEMLTDAGGVGLDAFIRAKAKHFHGILNGLGPEQRSPQSDPLIAANYTVDDLSGKHACRQALLKEVGLKTNYGEPVIGVVSRFVGQKGLDLVADLVPALPAIGAKLIVLGSGSTKLEDRFRHLAHVYPQHLALSTTFDPPFAQRIYAGCDLFLVPSLFEPCGLTQMQAMAYGTVPVVRAVGGLKDTVLDPRQHGESATGFCFYDYHPDALIGAVVRAVDMFRNRFKHWRILQKNGMRRDASWETSARRYRGLYDAITRRG
ncbi:MAG: glycogen synthase [Planctomycetes bacterium]|nr:glycogen synthase [Planctomycetota bacterium]